MKLFKSLFRILLIVAIGLSFSSMPNSASAMTSGGISVMPLITKDYPTLRSWFVYEAPSKTVINDVVEVGNLSNKTVTLQLAVLDGAVTGDGGYTLVGGPNENKDLGTWTKLEKNEITLPAKSKQKVKMTITVPDNADVGSHPGGVVAWEKPDTSSAKNKNSMITTITRVAARVYLTVPGDIVRKLQVKRVRHYFNNGVLYFALTMKNQGNVMLSPESDITLKGLFGTVGEQIRSQFGLILRDGEITSQVPWQQTNPVFGRYVANFRIHYGEEDFKNEYIKDEYADVKYVFWLLPWIPIVITGGVLVLLWFLRNLWLWLAIRQRINMKTQQHTVKTGENLTVISNRYGVDVKRIAKFNLLKWPYDLQKGDVLLIPLGKSTEPNINPPFLQPFKLPKWLVSSKLRKSPTTLTKPTTLPQPTVSEMKLESVIVEAGDTVADVAKFAGASEQTIVDINNLRKPYRLRVGQELMIPVIKAKTPVKLGGVAKKHSVLKKNKSTKSQSSSKNRNR